MTDSDRRFYEAYYDNRADAIEAEIQRLTQERAGRTHEQWLTHLQNKARLAELERRRISP
jgi:hypothetical protein